MTAPDIVEHFTRFAAERRNMRGIDHNEIAGMHIGDEREVCLTVADLERAATEITALRGALAEAVREIERNTCVHDDTYRGGTIWTICHGCGRKWADDEGGFRPDPPSPAALRARALLEPSTKESA